MKTMTAIVCGLLVAFPIQPKAQLVQGVLCITAGAAAIAGITYVYIHTCRPKYYCCQDSETGQQWCRELKPNEAAVEGLKVISGPYSDASFCSSKCDTNPVAGNLRHFAEQQSMVITIEKSFDLKTWYRCGCITNTIDAFVYSEPMEEGKCFYRVSTGGLVAF